MKCGLCRKTSVGTLCTDCEKRFKQLLNDNLNIKYNYKIGDTLYTLKQGVENHKTVYKIIKVIFKGPDQYFIKNWRDKGDTYVIHRFKDGGFKWDINCSSIDNKHTIYHRCLKDLYVTENTCARINKRLLDKSKIDEISFTMNQQYEKTKEAIRDEILENELNYIKIEVKNKLYEEINTLTKNYTEQVENLLNNFIEDLKLAIK